MSKGLIITALLPLDRPCRSLTCSGVLCRLLGWTEATGHACGNPAYSGNSRGHLFCQYSEHNCSHCSSSLPLIRCGMYQCHPVCLQVVQAQSVLNIHACKSGVHSNNMHSALMPMSSRLIALFPHRSFSRARIPQSRVLQQQQQQHQQHQQHQQQQSCFR